MLCKKKKLVILDCDDVLLDYIGGFKNFVLNHYNIETKGMPEDYTLYEWLGISQPLAISIMKHFNENSYEFGLLKPLDCDTVPLMNKLYQSHNNDTDFVVVTKCGSLGHSSVLRIVNLKYTFGDIFKNIIILETNESKKNTFKMFMNEYDDITVVDDYKPNIDTAHELGIKTFFMKREHNVKFMDNPKYNFVENWKELYHKLNLTL